jgi:hypothetical protein
LTTTGSHTVVRLVRWPIVASALWTFFVWGTRVRNVAGDDDLSGGERAFGYLVSALFIASAIAMVALLAVRGYDRLRRLLPVFAVATVGWWLVRSVLILVDDHGWGFRIVHLVLGVISSVLAVVAWRAVAGPERPFRAGSRVRS